MTWILFVPAFSLVALALFVLVKGDKISELTRVKCLYFVFGAGACALVSQAGFILGEAS